MRIYCKHSPMFKNPDSNIADQDKKKYIRCSPGFHDVPEWVKQDITFISGVKHNIIEVIESKAAEASKEAEEDRKGRKGK